MIRTSANRTGRLGAALAGAALLLPATVAPGLALPPADPNSIVTLQVENDGLLQNSDKYYTSGVRLAYTSPTDAGPAGLIALDKRIWGDGRTRISIDLQQTLFTPSNTQIKPPNPADRPYAGVLIADFNMIHDTDFARSTLGIGLGVVGPGALGEQVQNGFHHLIGDSTNKGWGYQLGSQPVIQFMAERIWRVPIVTVPAPVIGGIEIDALPQVTGVASTYRTYAQAGLELRIGQGLTSDFGTSRIRPGLSGGDAYVTTTPFAWYIFAGGDGQGVAYDATLDGNLLYHSRHVTREPGVGEITAGAAVLAYGFKLAFVHVSQTKEFSQQKSGFFNFDGITISAKF